MGPHPFYKHGEDYFRFFKQFCNLQPNDKVLDVGCGIGRMAVPLTKFLTEGEYYGFDVMPYAIKWARKEISSRYPNFHFKLVDVYNKEYNPKGKIHTTSFKFPFPDENFTFVFLTSVFTHMQKASVEHYFSEIARVLKKGGRTLITWFLLNQESLQLIKAGRDIPVWSSHLPVKARKHAPKTTMNIRVTPISYTINRKTPEKALGYHERYIKELYQKNMFEITGIYYGSWAGRKKFLHIQDVVTAVKN